MSELSDTVQKDRYIRLAEELGLGVRDQLTALEPLTGGVASDIVKITIAEESYCLKCALEKLKVKEEWHAPVHRNAAEYAWLEVASRVNPESAIKLFGRSVQAPCFAMEYLAGENVYLWKDRLLEGRIKALEAQRVGSSVGRVHAMSSRKDFPNSRFINPDDFYHLRLEPYLAFTADHHPEVAHSLQKQIRRLGNARTVLIHGDVSPKNILFRDDHPVLLDAECATMGDPCFDVAFCLTHLILKAAHLPGVRTQMLDGALAFWHAYALEVDWEALDLLEKRVCELVPALMLARIDGKSPVEYLNKKNQALIRSIAIDTILNCPQKLTDFTEALSLRLEKSI